MLTYKNMNQPKTMEFNQFNTSGQKHGKWVANFENGYGWCNYVNGVKVGEMVLCYNNGQIYTNGNFVNGKLDGYWVIYHENGQIYSHGNYLRGKKIGEWLYYNDEGYLTSKEKHM